jgi:hypothetical protein
VREAAQTVTPSIRAVLRMSWSPRPWLAMSALAVVAVGAHWCREFGIVDRCLDAGYVYDYARGSCEHDGSVPPPDSYVARHSVLLTVAGIVALGGIVAAVALRGRGEGEEPEAPSQALPLFMALAIMALAVWALPSGARPILGAATVLGAIWAAVRRARQRRSGG